MAAMAATSRLGGWSSADEVGISDIDLGEPGGWAVGLAGCRLPREMDYMYKHGLKRSRPAELVPGHPPGHLGSDVLFAARMTRSAAPRDGLCVPLRPGRDYPQVLRTPTASG